MKGLDVRIEDKKAWYKRTKKEDPSHARLFCERCVRYLGAAGKCECP